MRFSVYGVNMYGVSDLTSKLHRTTPYIRTGPTVQHRTMYGGVQGRAQDMYGFFLEKPNTNDLFCYIYRGYQSNYSIAELIE